RNYCLHLACCVVPGPLVPEWTTDMHRQTEPGQRYTHTHGAPSSESEDEMAFVPNLRTLRVALVPQQMKTGLGRLANAGSKCRCPSCGDSVEAFMAQGTEA